MAIGTPVALGNSSALANVSTGVITLTAAVATGNLIVVAAHASVTTAISTVTDSKGNTYVVDNTSGTTRRAAIASAQCTIALAINDTITVTYASASSATRTQIAFSVSGLATSSALDKAPTASTGTVAAWGGGLTGTLTQADEIIFGVVTRGGSTTSTPGGSFTEVEDTNVNSLTCGTVYQIVSATTSLNPGGTFAASGTAWDSVTASYKGLSTAITSANDVSMWNLPTNQPLKIKTTVTDY